MLYRQIGAQVRSLRREHKLTQEQLAEKAGISLSFLGHIERGTRKMSVETLYALSKALDCSADTLLGTGRQSRSAGNARLLLEQALLLASELNHE